MSKSPNTFQKRQREYEKKRKAEEKRQRRLAQKNAPETDVAPKHTEYDESGYK